MIIETSWDDGSFRDLRIAQLLGKYGLTGVFYIPVDGPRSLTWEEVKYLAEKFEVGSHTLNHPQDLKQLEEELLWAEIQTSKDTLENVIGKTVSKFCYPRGRYNQRIVEMVGEAGYTEARTTEVGWVTNDFLKLKKPTTVHAYPNRKEYKGVRWLDYAKFNFVQAKALDGYFHLWGHADEVNKLNLWEDLEELLAYIATNKPS